MRTISSTGVFTISIVMVMVMSLINTSTASMTWTAAREWFKCFSRSETKSIKRQIGQDVRLQMWKALVAATKKLSSENATKMMQSIDNSFLIRFGMWPSFFYMDYYIAEGGGMSRFQCLYRLKYICIYVNISCL